MNDKPLFSVVLIARNEAKTLPRLLGSLEEFLFRGGELILVDTGSTDDTVSIARNAGAKVHEVTFTQTIDKATADEVNSEFCLCDEPAILRPGDRVFNFAEARNYAASLATNDVIAMPDCDEVYTNLDIDAINAAIKEGVQQFEYDFVFSHSQDGRPETAFRHCKFYDRRKLTWKGIIHEILVNTGLGAAKVHQMARHEILLEHYQNQEQDRSGYLRGLALDCFYDRSHDRNWHYFGRELMHSGRPQSAMHVLAVHVHMQKWPVEAAQSKIYMGDIAMKRGAEEVALMHWHNALIIDGTRREPWLRIAQHYVDMEDPQRAASYAEAALTVPWSNYYGNRVADYAERPHLILAWAYYWLGLPNKAKDHWQKAKEYAPKDPYTRSFAQFFS